MGVTSIAAIPRRRLSAALFRRIGVAAVIIAAGVIIAGVVVTGGVPLIFRHLHPARRGATVKVDVEQQRDRDED